MTALTFVIGGVALVLHERRVAEPMLPLAIQAAMAAIEKICPEAKNLLLIPEKHTRNTFYLANVQRLVQIFHMAGLNVRLGTLDDTITKPTEIALPRRPSRNARVPSCGSTTQQ